jgi:hypothetical protein
MFSTGDEDGQQVYNWKSGKSFEPWKITFVSDGGAAVWTVENMWKIYGDVEGVGVGLQVTGKE